MKNLIDSLLNFVTYLVFFDSICFEIFDQIFNIVNYFVRTLNKISLILGTLIYKYVY